MEGTVQLAEEQCQALLEKYGVAVSEACDRCGQILGPVRFTRVTELGVWCSRLCRDGAERRPGTCETCGTPLNGKRKGARFCSDVCRKRWRVQNRQNIAETSIQNTPLTGAISASGYTHSVEQK
jgi:hypothetical protein